MAFRAHVSAAPLKRMGRVTPIAERPYFPRSRERGPIEAASDPSSATIRSASFRAHVSAAPLKRVVAGHYVVVDSAVFPRSRERGPIEAAPIAALI